MNIVIEDIRTHRNGIFDQGCVALLLYRFGHKRFIICNRWLRLPWTLIYWFLNKICEIFCGISIHGNAIIGRRLRIEHFGTIIIHGNSIIGDDCVIRHETTIGNRYKDKPYDAPVIGNRVNIGAGAKLLGKITIGDDVNIGANAVVLEDLPPNSTAIGCPARIVKHSD